MLDDLLGWLRGTDVAEVIRAGLHESLTKVVNGTHDIGNAIEAYKEFDRREPGWVKGELRPQVH